MTKSFAVASLFCLTSTIAHAQNNVQIPGFSTVNKPVFCGPADTVFQGLADTEINEKPIWIGTAENGSNFAVFMNTKTTGFTIIQFGKTVACIIGIGDKSSTLSVPEPTGKAM